MQYQSLGNQFGKLRSVCDQASTLGRARIALPDTDPDAACSAHALVKHAFPKAAVTIFNGDGSGGSIRQRAPMFLNDIEIRPIAALENSASSGPLLLLDAATVDQRNVGGPKGITPDAVIDTHSGPTPPAKQVALLSERFVATGSIVTEYLRSAEAGVDQNFWQTADGKKSAAGLRFGIHTDSGEGNYGTTGDAAALSFLKDVADKRTWRELQSSPFFSRVLQLFEEGKRLYNVRNGFYHVNFRSDELENCRDYLGAVADRLLHHLQGIAILATGEIAVGESTLLCVSLRVNRFHSAFDSFDAPSFLSALTDAGGGFGCQVNRQVWGGTVRLAQSSDQFAIREALLSRFRAYADDVYSRLCLNYSEK